MSQTPSAAPSGGRSVTAARLHAAGDVRVLTRPAAPDLPGRTRVAISSVGLCGSDVHWYTEGRIGDVAVEAPMVLGHEMTGVALDGPLAGRAVAVDPAVPCRRCPTCEQGLTHLCPDVDFAGQAGTDGGLQSELVWPTAQLLPVPPEVAEPDASLLEPLGVAVHSLDLATVRPGMPVGVVGCGPIGLLVIQIAAAWGCPVTAVEPLAHRAEAARRAGAEQVLATADPAEVAQAVAGGRCPVVVEVSGADAGLATAAHLLSPGGRIVVTGIPDGDTVSFSAATMRRKGVTLAVVRRMSEAAFARGARLAAAGVVDLSWLITDRFALRDTGAALQSAAARQGLKVAVDVAAG